MDLNAAALQVGKSANYLRVAIHRGILKATKIGNSWGVEQADLDHYADHHMDKIGRKPSPSNIKRDPK